MLREYLRKAAGNAHFEANTTIFRIPKCPACGGANGELVRVAPGVLAPPADCQHCGAKLPEIDEIKHVSDVSATLDRELLPWYALALLAAAKALRTLARRLEQ